jgi:hypothetical protein
VTNTSTSSKNSTYSPNSLPLIVSLGSPTTLCSDGGNCSIRVNLYHKLKLSSSQSSLPSTTNSSFEVDCEKGIIEDHSFVCPSGEVMTMSCKGSFSMRGRGYCPTSSSEIKCLSTGSQDISCHLSEGNVSMSMCLCDLSKVGVIGDDSPVSFSIVSIEKSVSGDFVSTWVSIFKS